MCVVVSLKIHSGGNVLEVHPFGRAFSSTGTSVHCGHGRGAFHGNPVTALELIAELGAERGSGNRTAHGRTIPDGAGISGFAG